MGLQIANNMIKCTLVANMLVRHYANYTKMCDMITYRKES